VAGVCVGCLEDSFHKCPKREANDMSNGRVFAVVNFVPPDFHHGIWVSAPTERRSHDQNFIFPTRC